MLVLGQFIANVWKTILPITKLSSATRAGHKKPSGIGFNELNIVGNKRNT